MNFRRSWLTGRVLGSTLAATLLGGVAMLGCPGTLAEKECFLQERDAHNLLLASCLGTGCHGSENSAADLDLQTSGLGTRLKDQVSKNCDGKILVVAGDPEASVLYSKLLDSAPCGSRMPLGQPALYDEDIETIRIWIAGLDGSCAGGGAGGSGGSATSAGGAGGSGGGSGGTGGSGGAGGSGGTGGSGGGM